MPLIHLTDYVTGRPVAIDPDSVIMIVPIEASVVDYIPGKPPTEHGERTRIRERNGDVCLVRETSDEVLALFAKIEKE